MREIYLSGVEWEEQVGYSRAVRCGNHIMVSGTTATDNDGNIVGKGDPYRQTIQALKNIEKALKGLGAKMDQIVRTRMFVTDINQWQEYGRAHGEVFSNIKPATSMLEISRLINSDMLIEIEVDVMIDNE